MPGDDTLYTEDGAARYRWEVRNEIRMAQSADMMARECRQSDDKRPRRRSDAPVFRELGFEHRQNAREMVNS